MVEALANDSDSARRSQLFFSIPRVRGAADLIPDLLRVVRDPRSEDDVVSGAMTALAQIGRDSEDERVIVDALLGVLLDRTRTSELRAAAGAALQMLGPAPTCGRRSGRVTDVVGVMTNPGEPSPVRLAAMEALAPLGVGASGAFEALLGIVVDERSSVDMVFAAGTCAGVCGVATPETLERVMNAYDVATDRARGGFADCMEGLLRRNTPVTESQSRRLRAIASETPNCWLRKEIERTLQR
jgi:hypothetical protein